jgi:uncharacterized membrane protein YqjE
MTAEPVQPQLPPADASVADLVRRASEDMSRLVRAELALAKVELTGKARNAGVGAGLLGTAAVTAAYGLGVLVIAATVALALVWPAWLAALVMGVVLLAVAWFMSKVGVSRIKRAAPPAPLEAMQSVQADAETVKAAMQR